VEHGRELLQHFLQKSEEIEMTNMGPVVLQGATTEKDERAAATALHGAIHRPDEGLVLFFCASTYDPERLGAALAERFTCPVIGCTTAGEITKSGYLEGNLVGVSISSSAVTAHATLIEPLDRFGAREAGELARTLAPTPAAGKAPSRFGFLLIDGLSLLEEQTVMHLYTAFGNMPIIGGSAGDDLAFRETRVFANGRFAKNAAAFCVIESELPFRTFKTQHFKPTDKKLVITEADPPRRRVMEIDGMPATEAYAEALGLKPEQLDAGVFSAHPVILEVGGEIYVRSIQRAEPDGSLVFFCAIDNGLVLTIGEGVDFAENLHGKLKSLEEELGGIELVLGCDCILRRLECKEKGIFSTVARVLGPYPFIGFSTYGEQIDGLHVNQTLTGVALGRR
jgi:hypothetical protein